MRRATVAAAIVALAGCSGRKDAGDPPEPRSPTAEVDTDARPPVTEQYLIATLTVRRVLDKVPKGAHERWPGYTNVTDRQGAARIATALASADTAIRQGRARIAIVRDAAQTFSLAMGDDYQVLFQIEGWQPAGSKLELKRLRFRSNYKLDVGIGSHGDPLQPVSVTIAVGDVYIGRGPDFSNNDVAFLELLELDLDELAAQPPADAVTGTVGSPELLTQAWSSWATIAKRTLP